MEEFMRDLEEDPELRSQIDLFRVPGVKPRIVDEDAMTDGDGEEPDFPDVALHELVDAVQHLQLD